MRAFKHAESLKRHELKEVFSDVYGGEEPLNLVGVSPFFPRSF
jgi:2-oxoisovalerate dehydrogenase E1 component alpha subunit